MQIDVLIIGQGISGTFLSHYLQDEGKTCIVLDDNYRNAPSRMAAGLINPVTGRRLVTVWMVEELFPFAWKAYQDIGHQLGITAISHRNIIDFFPNPFMRENFLQKIESGDTHVQSYPEQNHFNHLFNYEFGCGEIKPVYTVHLETLLPAWREYLAKNGMLREETFELDELQVMENGIRYRDINASKIVFCDGTASFGNPYFKQLPFAPNKGESLIVEIPGLPPHNVYKKSMTIVPLAETDMFWVGASYIWDFENASPTEEFLESTNEVLKHWLKIPFRVIEHRSGLRPATLERRPFVGFHPVHPSIGLLNGMGTKGCSLAPYFAKQLTDNFVHDAPIEKAADIKRFTRILSQVK